MLKIYAKNARKSLSEVREDLENEEKIYEAEWIYHKIRALGLLESFDDRECKEKIKKILEFIHRDHLDIMYIFFYRKKVFSDYLNLEILWKIQEFDE